MAKDVIITPASGLVDFKDTLGVSDATIQLDDLGNLNISNPGGELSIGDGGGNLYIGDGLASVDIIFEQNGSVRALTGKTLTLGQSDSFVTTASPFGFLSPDGTKQITARMLNTDALSFQGGAGELLSLSDSMTGTIFTVNDVSGIPSIEVIDTGLVKLAQYSGNVVIGSATNLGQKFQVAGTTALGTDLANYLQVTGATTTNAVSITTAGSDTNIGLTITTKGTGNIILDTGTSTGDIELKPGTSHFRLYDDDSSHYYRFITGNRTANYDITLPAGSVTLTTGTSVVTTRSISTTSPLSGGGDLSANRTFSLATGYGDTQNPYASKTANNFLAAPNGTAGVPTFRAIVAADIPTLNQNTTGSAATLTTTRTIWGQNFNGGANVTGAISGITTASMSDQLTNTLAIGTAPFVITSTTRVLNLNVATAGTADTLTTARTIGGVSFNGSANINLPGVNTAGNQNTTGSAATWTTARTLTIGSTGKSVNGGSNVAWSLAEIGAAASTSTVNLTGAQTVAGVKTFSSNISVPSAADTTGSSTAGINLNAQGSGYLFGTTGDGASSTISNVKLTSWFGIGFSPSISGQTVPQWQNAVWIDVRTGTIAARSDITAYASDERLKTNFVTIQNPLEKLKSIAGYEFDWLTDKCKTLGFQPSTIHEHGVKAQEIQRVVPDAVTIAPFDDNGNRVSKSGENYLTVKYEKLVPLLIESIKEQQTQIDELKDQLTSLTAMINTLRLGTKN
jgi:hypothetical protein